MPEETTPTTPTTTPEPTTPPSPEPPPQKQPWEILGFDSFKAYADHERTERDKLSKMNDEANKVIGRQGEELGNLRKAVTELGGKIESGKVTPPEPKPEEKVDYAAEVTKIEQTLDEPRLKLLNEVIDKMTPEEFRSLGIKDKAELATNAEVKYHILQEYVAAAGQPATEKVFGGSTATPAEDLGSKVRKLFRQAEDDAGRLPPPFGGVAPSAAGSRTTDPQQGGQQGRFSAPGGDLLGGLARSRGEGGSAT